MKTMYFRCAAWTVALGLGLILVTGASAQCGLPKKSVKPAAWHPSGKDRLLYVRANDDEEHGASIVGMWHAVFTGQTLNGAPFSGVVDNAVLVFHSDGTEIMNSSRPAQDGNFCLGVWERTGRFRYHVNHIPWQGNDPSNAPSGIGNPQAGAQLLEKIILDPDGNSYTGWFSLQAYDASGKPTVLFTGTHLGEADHGSHAVLGSTVKKHSPVVGKLQKAPNTVGAFSFFHNQALGATFFRYARSTKRRVS